MEKDWELSEEYYQEGESQRKLSLEDFIEEASEAGDGFRPMPIKGAQLEKTVNEVKAVMELSVQGRTISQIAQALSLEENYVYLIQICAQAVREDDTIAVAHLLMME